MIFDTQMNNYHWVTGISVDEKKAMSLEGSDHSVMAESGGSFSKFKQRSAITTARFTYKFTSNLSTIHTPQTSDKNLLKITMPGVLIGVIGS